MPRPIKLALLPVLAAQAVVARRRAPVLPEADGPREGLCEPSLPAAELPHAFSRLARALHGAEQARRPGEPLRLLIVGDSSAAGVGVAHQERALAGHLARALARETGRAVRWQLRARSGATTSQALRLLQRDPPDPADVAVAVLGVNDVIDQVTARRAVLHRERLADWLLAHAGVRHVAFAPLPPVEQLPLLPPLLRRIAGQDARDHDAALARWAASRDDVSHVPIELTLDESVLAVDRFHPGEPVYRLCGEALARHIAEWMYRGGLDGASRAARTTPPVAAPRIPDERPGPRLAEFLRRAAGRADAVHHRGLAGHRAGDRPAGGA